MELTLEQKKNIMDFAPNFSEIAKKEQWISNYDTETDAIVIRTPRLAHDVEKKYINDEFAFYLNKNNEVKGIFIEYFMTNFISHHKDVKDIKKEIEKEIKAEKQEESGLLRLEPKETKKIISELENVLIVSLWPKT